ncbi:urease accessory protein UreE, partial [Pseudomonas fragi]|nr:urease accessory protein UreE [Pseudomonas sp. GC01]
MILIEHILGNAKKDPVWKQKLEGANVDLLVLDQREAQKSRCRRTSIGG